MLKIIGLDISANTAWYLLLLIIAVGFVLIIYGGNFFVDSAIWLSKILKIPPIIIGATIVSIGTTLPEICVSIMAAIKGSSATALGNATGSPFVNQTLILGIILAFSVATANPKAFAPKAIILSVSVILLALFVGFDQTLGLIDGIILLAIFAFFMVYSVLEAKKNPLVVQLEEETQKKDKPLFMIIMFIVGALGIALGAACLVDGVSAFAYKIGISEQLIAITVVSLGTSLPELVTAITSLKKKNPALSIGNIIGANIINITFICGISAVILSLKNGQGAIFASSDDFKDYIISTILILIGLAVIFIPILTKKRTFKFQGVTLIAIYTAYLGYLILNATVF